MLCNMKSAADAIRALQKFLKDVPDCWKDFIKKTAPIIKNRDNYFNPTKCCEKAHKGGLPGGVNDVIASMISWMCDGGKCPALNTCRKKFPDRDRCIECCGLLYTKGSPSEDRCIYACY